MNLRHIEVFRAVMLTGTVTGAADLLHVSPPAVSKLLALAERRAGVRLFERVKGRLAVTPEGRCLFSEVEGLWKRVERVREVARDLANPTAGSLGLGISPSFGTYLIPLVVADLFRRYPKLALKVDLLASNKLIEALVDGTVDVGVALLPSDHPNLSALARYHCGLVCVVPKDHRLAPRKAIRPADLDGERLISFSQITDARLLEPAQGSRIDMVLHSGPSACWFAQAGAGVAVVDALTPAGGSFANVVTIPLKPAAKLDIRVLRNSHRPLSRVAEEFHEAFNRVWKEVVPRNRTAG